MVFSQICCEDYGKEVDGEESSYYGEGADPTGIRQYLCGKIREARATEAEDMASTAEYRVQQSRNKAAAKKLNKSEVDAISPHMRDNSASQYSFEPYGRCNLLSPNIFYIDADDNATGKGGNTAGSRSRNDIRGGEE